VKEEDEVKKIRTNISFYNFMGCRLKYNRGTKGTAKK